MLGKSRKASKGCCCWHGQSNPTGSATFVLNLDASGSTMLGWKLGQPEQPSSMHCSTACILLQLQAEWDGMGWNGMGQVNHRINRDRHVSRLKQNQHRRDLDGFAKRFEHGPESELGVNDRYSSELLTHLFRVATGTGSLVLMLTDPRSTCGS